LTENKEKVMKIKKEREGKKSHKKGKNYMIIPLKKEIILRNIINEHTSAIFPRHGMK
jgi:hypothetical protein